jgi:hypothetical protein
MAFPVFCERGKTLSNRSKNFANRSEFDFRYIKMFYSFKKPSNTRNREICSVAGNNGSETKFI